MRRISRLTWIPIVRWFLQILVVLRLDSGPCSLNMTLKGGKGEFRIIGELSFAERLSFSSGLYQDKGTSMTTVDIETPSRRLVPFPHVQLPDRAQRLETAVVARKSTLLLLLEQDPSPFERNCPESKVPRSGPCRTASVKLIIVRNPSERSATITLHSPTDAILVAQLVSGQAS
jgi:hypothetical protein